MSHGDWLLVVHADARLPVAALRAGEAALARPDVQAAAWPLAIDGHSAWLRVVERGAALRWRLTGLAYGDQGLLVRRSLYDAAGGYPDTRIMEDVVLVRRLARLARVERLSAADPRRSPPLAARGEGPRDAPERGAPHALLAGVSADRLARWYRPESASR